MRPGFGLSYSNQVKIMDLKRKHVFNWKGLNERLVTICSLKKYNLQFWLLLLGRFGLGFGLKLAFIFFSTSRYHQLHKEIANSFSFCMYLSSFVAVKSVYILFSYVFAIPLIPFERLKGNLWSSTVWTFFRYIIAFETRCRVELFGVDVVVEYGNIHIYDLKSANHTFLNILSFVF